MISKTTLEAVNNGILTDAELQEALVHYTSLEQELRPHGEKYHLVWRDVFNKLSDLQSFWRSRSSHRKLSYTIEGIYFK